MLQFRIERRTLHFRKPAATSRGLLQTREIWLILAEDRDRGPRAGIGECGPIPGLSADDFPDFDGRVQAAIDELNRASLETPDSSTLTSVCQRLDPFDELLAPLPSLRCALETALLDLAAAEPGVLWPSPFTLGEQGLATHGLIWMDSPAGVMDQVRAKVEAGFTCIKMKVGALDWATELSFLRDIRAAWPEIELRLDANGAFSTHTAAARLEDLFPLNIAFFEQPLPAGLLQQSAELCRNTPIPIALDEELIGSQPRYAAQLLETIRPQHLILKPALLGGFSACRTWIDAADSVGCQWWANSLLESAIGHDAICQWVAADGEGRTHGLGTGSLFTDNFPSRIQLVGPFLYRSTVP